MLLAKAEDVATDSAMNTSGGGASSGSASSGNNATAAEAPPPFTKEQHTAIQEGFNKLRGEMNTANEAVKLEMQSNFQAIMTKLDENKRAKTE